jgi:hypothetical protein
MSARRKLTLEQVATARRMRAGGVEVAAIARWLGVRYYAAWCLINWRTYK